MIRGTARARPDGYRFERTLGGTTTKRVHVRGILEQLIDAELNPGDAIPSERALVGRLG